MHLWTEYEGNTLEGFLLSRLARSEGRSAFFLTQSPEEQPALLRLTESHFDEGEMVGRWQKIAAVTHPGLQHILRFGQTTFDDVPLAYCLLENFDVTLSDVLRERVLSSDEAVEVAAAVGGALTALHSAGLVHGHVDATNIFAVGEAVKLRADCARECTGDFEADTPEAREALRQRDVHDLGMVLRRCLTPQWQESAAMSLPSPFDRIVRRALNGTVSAAEIFPEMDELRPAAVPAGVAASAAPQASAPRGSLPAEPHQHTTGSHDFAAATRRRISQKPSSDVLPSVARPGASAFRQAANSPLATMAALEDLDRRSSTGNRLEASFVARSATPSTAHRPSELKLDKLLRRSRHNAGTTSLNSNWLLRLQDAQLLRGRKAWAAAGAIVAVFGLSMWSFAKAHHPEIQAVSRPANVAQIQRPLPPAEQVTADAPSTPPAAARSPHAVPGSLLNSGAKAGWHVIAYTYHYEQQARARVLYLKSKHVALQPQVFSPTGRAPYFVALGGSSDAASALLLRNRARQAGLPHDTYARNF